MNYKYAFFIILLLFGFVLVGNKVYGSAGLGIQPIKISHTINPGESVSGIISLKNASANKINVEAIVEDFVPDAGSADINFIGRAEGNTTVRDWITLNVPKNFVFNEGESREITYTIKAPVNAEPGGHFGVAFFKATDAKETGSLRVGTRLGMLIFVTIPGNQLQKGRVLDFKAPFFVQKGPVDFTIKFENIGTVHFEPKGSIKITNIFGKKVGDVAVEGRAVLPTGVRDLTAQWNVSRFLLGRYKAEISVRDGEGNILTAKSVSFYAFPIWYIAGFIAAVLIIFFGLKFFRKKVKFSVSLKS